jgi:alkaline phosphatase
MRFIYIFFVLVVHHVAAIGQPKQYTLANAHSHNDYLQSKPLTTALQAGFGSIEADIFPVNEDLLVAHSEKEIDPSKSLNALYLKPLLTRLKNQAKDRTKAQTNSKMQELQLLIDIKTDTKSSMELLIKQLKPLKKYLSSTNKKRQLKIVMTGKIPLPDNFNDYPDYIFYDNDLSQSFDQQQWQRVGMVSVNFKNYSKWKGKGALPQAELSRLNQVIGQAHQKNKPFRFWGASDQAESWSLQMQLGADWIGTDHIGQLSAFLKAHKSQTE